MIEYHAHEAVLNALKANLATAFDEPALASQAQKLADAADIDRDAATLGSFIDVLLEHAGSDGVELQLLEQAASLWKRGLTAYQELGLARQELELAMADPTKAGALAIAQSSISRLAALKTTVTQLGSEMQALRDQIAPLPHLKPHARQNDEPSSQWTVRDAFLGRRTDAFVSALLANANDVQTRALAVGAVSGFAGNAAGSAFLGAVVGGPRRSHRYRDRLARNTLGSWLKSNTAVSSLPELARRLSYRGAIGGFALPNAIKQALESAFSKAHPSRSQPSWNLGLNRLVRHLELLIVFSRPLAPDPPMTFMSGNGDDDIPGMMVGGSGGDAGEPKGPPEPPGLGGEGPDTGVSEPGKSDSKSSGGDACLGIILGLGGLFAVGLGLLIFCIFQWAAEGECKPEEFFDELLGSEEPDPTQTTGINQGQLTAISTPEASGHILLEMFKLQLTAWQAFDLALSYLTVTGLIYPDELLITSPLYQQFLRVPQRAGWPHREEANALETYHFDPVSAFEAPASAVPFPANADPWRLTAPWPSDYDHSANAVAMPLLRRFLTNADPGENLDLDADRGFGHPCWAVAGGGSINDPSFAVDVLAYSEE
ncbi:MAG: hypothetical protein MT490_08670 [Sphingomonas sp.]|uniref:hypothetical protein n=1 Tax=Sphingomonas sp. TaxID=28214 RepID=UPI0022739852|nr:hypothetical protein [Sphingomonas sp.]MCX8475854.1 hypothetical protein [Sphingomonas sp.]